jgi:aspartate racemase
LAANTPHHRFEAITRDVPLRVVHIVDAVAQTAKALQFDSLLLLGTRLTMESAPIRLRFASHSVPVAAPSPDKQSRLISLIQRLQSAQTTGAAQEIARLSQGSRAVVLGCTELALAFPHAISMPVFEEHGRTYLNSLAIHIRAILDAVAART